MTIGHISELPDVPLAGTSASKVYTLALRSEYVDVQRCVRELGISEAEAAVAVDHLVRLRLLHLVHGCTYAYVAVDPLSASQQLLAVQEEALRQRAQSVERLRQQMHSLLPLYRANLADAPQQPPVQRVEDAQAARGILATVTAGAKREILLSLPTEDPWEEDTADPEHGPWPRYAGTRPDLLKVLLPEAARFDVRVRERAESLHAHAGEVRTSATPPAWLLVVDAEVAVVPVDGGPGLSVVHEPSVVTTLWHTLTGAWGQARPFDGRYDHDSARSASALIDESILRMLLNGLEDKVIARRLDISLRTCQRRIADLMDALGARTRLQAGYVLGRRLRTGERQAA
ncbi:LuxR family transcriptional regulator [Streptomyces sp. AC555_RSS877]|uniref:LuxR family transcriptional regulator n=1 Tax=Streptomyces sp. AC555_RSS877 TaxID=2823688 RepID=UPI001C26072D|nr:LuxR family transcriptional regulator [Streptomyces sp. AC555_RSS877]